MTKLILFNQWLYLKGIIILVLLLKMKKKCLELSETQTGSWIEFLKKNLDETVRTYILYKKWEKFSLFKLV